MSPWKPPFFLCLALVLAAARTCMADPCDSLKEPYEKARCFNGNRQYTEALFLMPPVVRADSLSRPKAMLYLSLLIECDDKPGLKKYTPLFQKRFSGSLEGALLCARGYDKAGEWKKAASLLERAYGRDGRFEYLAEMLSVYMRAGQYDFAGSIIQTVLRADSAYAPAYHAAGNIALKTSFIKKIKERKRTLDLYREALASFQRAIRFDSLNYRYYMDLAEVYRKLNIQDSAVLALRRAVDLNGGDFKLLVDFSDLLMGMKMYDTALVFYEKAFLLDSINVDLLFKIEAAHKRLGTHGAYYLKGQERLANAMPDTLSIRYNLAVEYTKRKMFEEGKAAYLKVLVRDPRYQEANRGMAAIYLFQDSCAKAVPFLEKQALILRGQTEDLVNIAACCLRENDTAAAVTAYEKIILADPRNAPAAYFLATWQYNLKKYDKCLDVLAEGLAYPDSLGVFRMRGGSLFHLKADPKKIIQNLVRCVGTGEEDETLHYMLAQSYERAGERKKAASEYRQCIRMAPGGPNAEFYRSRIRELE